MSYTKAFGKVIKNEKIGTDIFDLVVKTPQAKAAEIGQFMQILIESKVLRRPISICEIDRAQDTLRMVYLIKGEGTKWLSKVKSGDTLDLLGPVGHGFSKGKNILVIGGGIGVPPLLQTAKEALSADAILGYKTKDYAVLTDDFEKCCDKVLIATDDGSLGTHGFVTDILKEQIKLKKYDMVCTCGPIPMLKAVSEICESADIPCEVSLEERMGCGVGACVGCVCKIKSDNEEGYRHLQVCKYGPVINSKEVLW